MCQIIGHVADKYFIGGKSGLHKDTVPVNGWRGWPQG